MLRQNVGFRRTEATLWSIQNMRELEDEYPKSLMNVISMDRSRFCDLGCWTSVAID